MGYGLSRRLARASCSLFFISRGGERVRRARASSAQGYSAFTHSDRAHECVAEAENLNLRSRPSPRTVEFSCNPSHAALSGAVARSQHQNLREKSKDQS